LILSVVMPTHNKLALLRQTLAALGQQQAGSGREWEVVVVDDGSSDGTAQWLSSSATELVPSLRVVAPPSNVGRARARNLGASAATGHWILFMDDDIVAPPGLLAAHLDLLENTTATGTIGWACTDDTVRDAPHFHYLDTRGVARLPAGPAPARFFVTQNAAVPRQAFLEVGGFDEGFTAYGFEDMELAFRLEDRLALDFRALPAPVPRHVHHHSLQEYFAKKVECGGPSLRRLLESHPGRLSEMRLESVVGRGGLGGVAIRIIADSALGGFLRGLLAHWPTGRKRRPRAAAIYLPLMSLAVLCCFREGWLAENNSAK